MFTNPVEQGAFETDIVAEPFRLDPFVPEDFLPFRQEFLIETRLLHEFTGRTVGLVRTGGMHGDHGKMQECLLRRLRVSGPTRGIRATDNKVFGRKGGPSEKGSGFRFS